MIAKDVMKKDFISIDKEDTISKLIGKFKVSKKTEAVVLDKKRYAGIACKRKMLKPRMKVGEEKIKRIMASPAVLEGKETLEKAAQLLYASDAHMLPVVKKGIVQGVVYALDVLKNLAGSIGDKRVFDISKKGKVIIFDEHMDVAECFKIMREKKIDRAPVVNSRNKLMGIVSAVDILMNYSIFPPKRPGGHNVPARKSSPGKPADLSGLPISNYTTFDVDTIMMEDKLRDVISKMDDSRISDVVVIDVYNQPIGIVTIKDLLKLF